MRVREALASFRGHRLPRFNIVGRKKWWFALSSAFIAASLIGLFVRGLNFSIDFEGGALLQYPNRNDVSVAEVQATLGRFGRGESEVQILGDDRVNIRTESLRELGDRQDALRRELAEQAGISPAEINLQDVSPTWGGTISRKALQGLIVFLVLVSVYISFRFEWKMAVGALAALFHDLIITAGIYALVGREVTPETVIAILTILGYSLYDTVVIFDKVKENTDSAALVARETYSGVVNLSLNQTLMRSVNTTLVVLLPIGALLLFGGETLKDFAFALFIGLIASAYSSVFIAAPVLAVLREREPRLQQVRARAASRAARPGLRTVPPTAGVAAPAPDRELEAAAVSAARVEGSSAASRVPVSRPTASKKKRSKPQGKPKRRRR